MTPIDQTRWAELSAAFDALVELDADARARRLAALGASDPALRRSLEELLEADASADTRLEHLDSIFRTGLAVPDGEAESPRDVLGLVGRTVAHFRVLETLASGGMGAIYRAVDTHLDRTVALKFPLPDRQLDDLVRRRFLREARAVGALDHPNVCSVYEAGETEDGHLFLAMPLYQGETLKARIAREAPLPVTDAVALAEQVARGLRAAHRAGIVHRDLKPANAMVLPDGELRILDFGTARVGDLTLTAAGDLLGTVPYMAPEQVRGDPVDARADLWALGVMLFEMLTGHRPFEGTHEVGVAHAIVHGVPRRPSLLRPEIGADLDALVLRLLEKDPARRPGSADAVVTELAGLAARSVSHRKPPWRLPRLRSDRRTAIRGAGAAIALVAVVAAWQLLANEATHAATDDPRTVAVLSFENLGGSGDEYLAIALPAEMAGRLSLLKSVAVPGERAALGLRDADRPPREVAGVLGAEAVVTGRVRSVGEQVILAIELFDARRDRVVLSREWDADRAGLAGLVEAATVATLDALPPPVRRGERRAAEAAAPGNPEAYDLYLRGRAALIAAAADEFNYPSLEPVAVATLREAEAHFARAREIDPGFAQARAALARTQMVLAPVGETAARRDQGRIEAETALRLQPENPEAHEALARYWMLLSDAQSAVGELERALEARPNAARLHVLLGRNLRELGRWEEAADVFERASRLDRSSTIVHYEAALTYARLRRYREAIGHWDQIIATDTTGDPFPRMIRGFNYLRLGDLDSLDAAIRRIPLGPDPAGTTIYARYTAHRILGRDAEALSVLDSARAPVFHDQLLFRPMSLLRAETLERMGRAEEARANYEAARSLLEDSVAAHPQNGGMRVALGVAYAGLGRRDEAMREARAASAIMPVSRSSPTATAFLGGALEIYARLGAANEAVEMIELLLAMPAGREVSIPLLRLDPTFDRIRGDPRFRALVGDSTRS